VAQVPPLAALEGPSRSAFHHALTELVNNAVDHSGATEVSVNFSQRGDIVTLEVVDRGVGIFRHLRERLGFGSELEALQELSKGKVTTMPDRHTGEGIFFTSKAADLFEIESGALGWAVDNVRSDMALQRKDPPRAGTRVSFALRPASARPMEALFAEYTEDYEFMRTRAVVKLFAIGVTFVSRSEAKRLLTGLDRFREVILDFAGVEGVGQGFADEVFRVWARAHPDVRLTPVSMCDVVDLMVGRALAAAKNTDRTR